MPPEEITLAQQIAAAIARELRVISLLGKDHLTVDEAAFCACVSNSQFRAQAKTYGIHSFTWMGKTCYRKSDITRAMDNQWQHYNGAAIRKPAKKRGGYSNGATPKARTASPSAKSPSSASAAPATSSAPNN